ncbi:MAG: flagellar hook-basal body complex protein FliE [Vicinamibacteraceae bacterium]|nr:flagellar hook-basal body complex protein FliE [Vicinamibacteraceae bacterium]
MAISSISGSIQTPPLLPRGDESRSPAQGFAQSLSKLVESVEESNSRANTAVADMLAGRGDVHDAMIALQKADLSLQFTVQVRNKLVQAYQEIMRMPV